MIRFCMFYCHLNILCHNLGELIQNIMLIKECQCLTSYTAVYAACMLSFNIMYKRKVFIYITCTMFIYPAGKL